MRSSLCPPWLGSLTAATFLFAPAVVAQPPTKPNTLLLIADDVGVDFVGAYGEGQNPPPTPNLDALAARGVLFRNAWVDAVCSPTRACVMTGRHGVRTGIGYALNRANNTALSLDEYILPEVLDLGGSGHSHALIGKWHLGGDLQAPNRAGWSHFAGIIGGSVFSYYNWTRIENGVASTSTTYLTTAQVDDALQWIGKQSGPWTCVVAFCAIDAPLQAPPPSLHSQNLQGLNPFITPIPFARAMMEALDTEIGRLLSGLGGELADTNVIFVGDNGTAFNLVSPPFSPWHAKGTPYEGGVNVPLIVAGPAVQAPGREVTALVAGVDLFDTVLDLAGVDARAVVPSWIPLDGVSLVPYLGNPNQPPLRSWVYAEQFLGSTFGNAMSNGFATVRGDRYKLIRTYGSSAPKDELYDLANDPFEQNDLTQAPMPQPVAMHYAALQTDLAQMRQPGPVLTPFGSTACLGSSGVPQLMPAGSPRLGGRLDVGLRGAPPLAPAALLLGQWGAPWAGPPLPVSLTALGAGPGCTLEVPVQTTLAATADPAGSTGFSLPIPNSLGAVGTIVQVQWAVVDPAAPGTLGITTTSALAARIGL